MSPGGLGQDTDTGPLALVPVIRKAFGLSGASLVGALIGAPTSFVVARWLSPLDFGRAEYVLLFYFYASLLRTGTFEAGVRTYIDTKALGRPDAAHHARDVAVTFETVAALLPGLVLVGAAFFLPDPLRRTGLLLAPGAVLASSVRSYVGGLFQADDRFGELAANNLIRSLLVPALLLGGIPALGAPVVFLAPIVGDGASALLLLARRPRLGLRPSFDWPLVTRLLRIGFPLGAASVIYWIYLTIGSTSVALTQTSSVFGVYAFAVAPVVTLASAIAAIHAVLLPAIWREMAVDIGDHWAEDGRRVTIFLAVLAGAAANLGQALFAPLVHLVAPRFVGSIPLFDVLSLNIFFLSIAVVPSVVIDSTRVNRQAQALAILVAALFVNAAANAAALLSGAGAMGIAVDDVWIQLTVVVAIFALAWRHLGDPDPWRRTLRTLAMLGAVTVLTTLGIHALPSGGRPSAAAGAVAFRLVATLLVWAGTAAAARHQIGWRR